MRILLFILIIVPAIEIGLLVLSGNTFGVLPTILLIILTGIVGAALAKQQGLETLRKAQEKMRTGELPGDSVIDGLCILIGGVLLLTPGFVTDTIGFFLLIPPTRKFVKPFIQRLIRKWIYNNRITIIR
ncbi:FxsA family protein [Metabacillus arenae]|uniref:Membrane protein FxsA n=1 Tax=Metabacillus arenae TaxID=2771434 RepID=A0A926NFE4_9BACI|nr:FxsA family protein [Metabacillus arenae]MBD1380095.1 membrane protein FxsA [Metabacillus arenae]